MSNKDEVFKYYIGIAVLSAVIFIPFLGQVHLFDWDEINFAESAREMIVSRDYLNVKINFISFYEKPPLFIWMQTLSMKAFGVNEFAARFPNAICGIVSLLILFHLGRKAKDIRLGILWTVMYAGSLLPFMYFKSGIIDPWFNLFIFLGVYQCHRYINGNRDRSLHLAASALFIGLGILTKGPVALLIYLLTVGTYLILIRFRIHTALKDILIFVFVLAVTGGLWFILQIANGNFYVIADFISYQVRLFSTQGAGHGGFFMYHFVVLLLGVFPASVFALPVIFRSRQAQNEGQELYRWMLILFWVVLILFTIVRTKIVHYSSMCYFPLTFMAAWWLHRNEVDATVKRIVKITILTIGIILAVVIACLTMIDYYKELLVPYINDPFAVACLQAEVQWHGFESIISLVMVAGLLLFSRYWDRKKEMAVMMLAAAMTAFMFLSMYLIAPRIEMYSQRAAVDFFRSVAGEDAYLGTIGYKSYAHYFYGEIKEAENDSSLDPEWLLSGIIDKPVYLSAKAFKKERYLKKYPDLQVLYEKNGFVFFKRVPKQIP